MRCALLMVMIFALAGYTDAQGPADGAARETRVASLARRFEFKPAVKNGQPVDSWVAIPCDFEFYEAEDIYLQRKSIR